MTIPYKNPNGWIGHDARAIAGELAGAKASVLALDTKTGHGEAATGNPVGVAGERVGGANGVVQVAFFKL